jgi:RNA-directed DNA polymerase
LLFTHENLDRHYLACRRSKRNTYNALRFEARQELNLLDLLEELQTRRYRPSPSVCFVTRKPKLREIFAADFRDRVVHHVLVDSLEAYWERVFIHDSYACRKGKGVHAGVARLRRFIGQVSDNGARRAWYLQLDIRNYFMRIDKALLWRLLEPHIADDDARWLTRVLVMHDCTEDYVYKGLPGELERVPSHKTLIRCEPGKGLPIGNLNSQFFANVYLNSLDQFVKHELKCRHYLRYCDDFVLLSPDRDQLVIWRKRIEEYLRDHLLLELNPTRERLRPVSDGVDFLGYIVRRDYLLVRNRVVNNLRQRLAAYEVGLVGQGRYIHRYRFDQERLDALHATLASYLGHVKMANSHKLWQSLWERFRFLREYFDYDERQRKLVRKYRVPQGLRTVRRQYDWFRWRFPKDVVFFQVGRFFEFYPGDDELPELLGLAAMKENRRGASHGFPEELARRYARVLLKQGRSLLVVRQADDYWTRIRERRPVWRLVPHLDPRRRVNPG